MHSGQLTVSRGGTPEKPLLHMDLPLREPTDTVPCGITAESDVVAVSASAVAPSYCECSNVRSMVLVRIAVRLCKDEFCDCLLQSACLLRRQDVFYQPPATRFLGVAM